MTRCEGRGGLVRDPVGGSRRHRAGASGSVDRQEHARAGDVRSRCHRLRAGYCVFGRGLDRGVFGRAEGSCARWRRRGDVGRRFGLLGSGVRGLWLRRLDQSRRRRVRCIRGVDRSGRQRVGCSRRDRPARRRLGNRLRRHGRGSDRIEGCRRRRVVERRRGNGDGLGRGLRCDRRCQWRDRSRRQQRQWIDVALRIHGDSDPQMHVGLRELDVAARSDRADRLALCDDRAARNRDRTEMHERDRVPVLCLDRHRLATTRDRAGEADCAGARRGDGGSGSSPDVDAAVLSGRVRVARAERERSQDGPGRRPSPGRGRRNEEQRREDAQQEHAHDDRLRCQG
jgi:hypothetical protein